MDAQHIAIVGAGLIGRQHLERFAGHDTVESLLLVDPRVRDREDLATVVPGLEGPVAAKVRIVADLDRALALADGAVLATPNTLHAGGAVAALRAGVPVLVEKPLADTEDAALSIVAAQDETGVPVLVGHHRRHSAALSTAHDVVASGRLGELVAIGGQALFSKPQDYFDVAPWRTQPGGGPLLINLVHDVDALRWLGGEITRVRAVGSSAARGHAVEDTAALILEFASGALGTFLLSDAAASHRSWEQSSGENPSYDRDPEADAYHLAGRKGSLDVPTLRLSTAEGEASWWSVAQRERLAPTELDPLAAQATHFLDVVRGTAAPLVTARDGLQALRIVLAASRSAALGGDAVDVALAPTSGTPTPATSAATH